MPQPQAAVIQASVACAVAFARVIRSLWHRERERPGRYGYLRGTVSSENDRLLAAQMAMLEPVRLLCSQ